MKFKKESIILEFIGYLLLLISSILAVIYHYPKFYLLFCISYVLILDHFNYKLRKESLINNLFSKKHIKSTIVFLVGAIVAAFVVDYLFGVRLFHIWLWTNYTLINWIVLYTLINFAFIILVYETYRIIEYFLLKRIPEKKIIIKNKLKIQMTFIILAIIGFIIPLANFIFFGEKGVNYTMLFPFISIFLLSDAYLTKFKTPITFNIIKHNRVSIYSILLTSLIIIFTHEFINTFAYQWKYINIPFMQLQVINIPIAVLIGWIPLILFCISFVELIVQIDKHKKQYKLLHI